MNKQIAGIIAAASTLALHTPTAFAAEPSVSGGTFVQVQDGTTAHDCIDVSKNLVSMQLVGAQLQRSQSWWDALLHKQNALGVKFDVVINKSGQTPFDFPRSQQLTAPTTNTGIALLPMRFPIMTKYSLQDASSSPYDSVALNLYFIEVDTASDSMKTLTTLVNFTKSLPLPPNPYVAGVGYFGDFANQIVQQDLQTGAGVNPDASFSFGLAANTAQAAAGTCPAEGLRPGVQSVVFDFQGTPTSNMIKTAESTNYCFWYDMGSGRIQFAPRPTGGGQCATTATASAKTLDNPLVTFIVSSWPAPGTPQPAPAQAIQTLQPSPAALSGSTLEIQEFAGKIYGRNSLQARNVNPTVVKGLLDDYNLHLSKKSHRSSFTDQATSEDVATTIALKRCAVVGIAAKDCQ